MITFLGSKSFKKPQYLSRKLPVSTLVCPAQCGYLDSMNVTAITSYDSLELSTATFGGYTSSAIDDREMTLLQNYFSISYFYVSVLGLIYTMLIGIGISLVTGESLFATTTDSINPVTVWRMLAMIVQISGGWKKRHTVDKRTVDPISLRRLSECLPTQMREWLRSTERAGSNKRDHSDDYKVNDEEIPLS